MKQLDEILQDLQQPMLETLKEWIRTPSVESEPEDGAPFGKDIRRMLDTALGSCEQLGLKTKNVNGYAGHADMGEGADEDALAILAHLDVVPVGDGWTREPFGAQVTDGKIFGRGTSDDKGPAVAALYAMHAVQQAGIPLKRKVRLILGCDEESGWEDIAYYKQHETMPRSGFSPDAEYPVINVEKGMLGLELSAPVSHEGLKVLSWSTGERTNVIPGIASALIEGNEDFAARIKDIGEKHGWPVHTQMQTDGLLVTTQGIPGHAAMPEGARNAIGQMLVILRDMGAQGALATLADTIGISYDGEKIGAKVHDAISGPLTCNLGIIRVDAQSVYATLDLRCPVLADHAKLEKSIKDNLPEFEVKKTRDMAPHMVPENSELVQSLLEAYHEVTGLEKKVLAIGGGTYAKALEEGVAFGASFPGEPEVAHQADEHIALKSLYDSMKVFAYAIVKLAGK